MIILAYIFLGERVKRQHIIGIILGLVGVLVLNLDSLLDVRVVSTFSVKGDGLLLLSGVFGSIGQIWAKKRCQGMDPLLLNGWQMTLGGGILLMIGTILNKGFLAFPSGFSIILMLYSIMVAAVGFTLWYVLLLKTSVNDIVPYRLTIPVLGSIFSAIFLPGERLSIYIVLGLAIVVLGMSIITFLPDKAS
jgi:drug/metabolite transporter (DMT)-like permease